MSSSSTAGSSEDRPPVLPAFRLGEAGLSFEARIAPGAKRTHIVGLHGDRLKIAVAAPAEAGKANRALCRFLAESFGVAAADVEVVRGQATRDKTILIRGLGPGAFSQGLEMAQSGRRRAG